MTYVGSWKIDDVLVFYANTQSFSTGVATDADAVPTYRVYEDQVATPLLTGSMALLDGVNTDGFYSASITLAAVSGFEKGRNYSIYITATVGGVVGTTRRTFQIQAEVSVASIVTDAIDSGAVAASAVAEIQAGLSTITAADVWAAATRTLTSGANIVLAKGVGVTGFTDIDAPGVRGAVGLAAANLDIQLATIAGFIDTEIINIQSRLPLALVGGRMDSNVGAMAIDTLTAAALAADATAEIQSGLSTLTQANVRTAVGLAAANLDTQLGPLSNLDVAVSSRLATVGYTAPDNAGIASILSFVDTEVAAILTDTAAIKAKTNLIPGTQDGFTYAQLISLIAAVLLGKVSGLPGAPAFRSVNDVVDRVTATTDVDGNRTVVTLTPA